MGGLHDGHRALIGRARATDATVVVSIFVNPKQFDDASDFTHYPRDTDSDLAMCEEEGVDLLWLPPIEEVYPPGFDTTVRVGAIADPLEGRARPGHFDGVATVVAIILAVSGAEHAYFGLKDAQQVLVVERMAVDLGLPARIVRCPTVRDPDGLALSSRNVHLSPMDRRAATVLHRALVAGRDAWAAGEHEAERVRRAVGDVLATEPRAEVEYVSCADARTLVELERVDGPALLSLAVRFGTTRLIDNEWLGDDPGHPVVSIEGAG
jgi:pantoate--beta-alanine ligase